MKTRYQIAMALAACLAGGSAVAATPSLPWYVGGSYGGVNTNASASDLKQVLVNKGYNVTSVNLGEPSTGWKLYGGFQFLPYLGVEAGYQDLGKIDATVKASGVSNIKGIVKTTLNNEPYSFDGWNVDLVGMLPVGPTVLFAKAGAVWWSADITATAINTGVTASRSDSGTGAHWGAGLKFPMYNNRIGIRGEWEEYRVNGRWIMFYSAGVEFHF